MPERDAFGNELRPSDGTSAFGAPTPEPAAPTPEPAAPTPEPAAFAPKPAPTTPTPHDAPADRPPSPVAPWAPTSPTSGRTARRAVGGCVSFVVVLTLVGGCMVGLVADKVTTGVDAVRSLSTEFSATVTPPAATPPPASTAPDRPSSGVGRGSLLRPAAFGAAVERLRRSGLGRLRNLRLTPARLDAQLVTRTGRLRSVQLLPGGGPKVLNTTPPGFSTRGTVSLARIDRGAPLRLAHSAAGRARTTTGAVDYLVLLDVAGTPMWAIYLRGGKGFRAGGDGRGVQAIG